MAKTGPFHFRFNSAIDLIIKIAKTIIALLKAQNIPAGRHMIKTNRIAMP